MISSRTRSFHLNTCSFGTFILIEAFSPFAILILASAKDILAQILEYFAAIIPLAACCSLEVMRSSGVQKH